MNRKTSAMLKQIYVCVSCGAKMSNDRPRKHCPRCHGRLTLKSVVG